MKPSYYFIFVFILVPFIMLGQSNSGVFKSGMRSLCKDDTTAFLKAMKKCSKSDKKTEFVVPALFVQGVYFSEKGDYLNALHCLNTALDKFSHIQSLQGVSGGCSIVFDMTEDDPLITKGLLFKKISSCYKGLNLLDSALLALNRIDLLKDFGDFGCVNALITQASRVSYLKATTYLSLKDTAAAIDQLLDYCLHIDGDAYGHSFRLLKDLLTSKYSKNLILQEIENSIQKAKMVKNDGIVKTEYYLFGRKIPHLYFSNLEDFKVFMANNRFLLFLKE